ncbi:MAG: 4-coumarate--CoA ligase, partial [Pseudomonadota bacterium]|nr:4-coumarate--CoA ligase [Pseudomonadota bacterium]
GNWASVGQAAGNAELMVMDEDCNVLPVGEVGEVIGRSATVMRGYHGRPDLTQKALVRLKNGEVYFRTGDLGRIDEDGFLFLAGRKKDMIISGGFNIYATDLEEALHTHPEVVEAGVAGAPDEEWGEIPWAGVVLRPGATVTEAELIAHANARLGKLQRIKRVFFIDVLPRNAIEKVDKPNLLKLLLSLA